VRGAVLAGLSQQVGDTSIGEPRDAFEAERGTRAVAKQTLECVAIALGHGHTGVDVESKDLGAPRALAVTSVFVAERIQIELRGGGAVEACERRARREGERELQAGFDRRELRRLVSAILFGPIVDELSTTKPLRIPSTIFVFRASSGPMTLGDG